MANLKISALTSASTPLAGTEVLPIVQSNTTVKVSVANLTAGRAVAVKTLTQTGDTGAYGITASNPSGYGGVNIKSLTIPAQAWSFIANDNAGNSDLLLYGGAAAQTQFTWDSAGNLKANTGNFVQGTAAKGVTTGGAFALGLGTNGSTSQVQVDTSGNLLVNAASANGKLSVETGTNSVAGFFKNATSGYQTVTVQNAGGSGTRYLEWFVAGTTDVGYISSDGTNTSYISLSDYRLKDNVAPMTGALEKLAKLTPRTFTWKSNDKQGQGFIAHELQTVFPEAVTGDKDETDEEGKPIYQGIDTSFLVATLVAAVQELQAEIAALKGK